MTSATSQGHSGSGSSQSADQAPLCSFCVAGRGFNNLSLVSMARHAPSGQLVALKRTNLDECAEEELLQLMVRAALTPDL